MSALYPTNEDRAQWALHACASFAAITGQVAAGEELEELVRGPERSEALLTHVSIGMIILIPVLYRMFWRIDLLFHSFVTLLKAQATSCKLKLKDLKTGKAQASSSS